MGPEPNEPQSREAAMAVSFVVLLVAAVTVLCAIFPGLLRTLCD